jgi:hypothetical protein
MAFRDDPEHHRSIATLATRLCGKVFAFVKRNLSGAQRRKDTRAGKGVRGKGAGLAPPQHTETRSAKRSELDSPRFVNTITARDRAHTRHAFLGKGKASR